MGKVVGLAHIGVMVKDIEASKAFYTEKLGFKVDDQNDLGPTSLCFLSNGTCLIELVCSEKSRSMVPGENPLVDHICMEVSGIEELVDSLKQQGIEFESEVNTNARIRGGVKNVFFHGPDNERIEFFEYL